jgi:hypothetical protein
VLTQSLALGFIQIVISVSVNGWQPHRVLFHVNGAVQGSGPRRRGRALLQ